RVSQRIPAGTVGPALRPGTAARIFTGAALPAGAEAVVMQEQCAADGDDVTLNALPLPGEHIRPAGDDIRLGEKVLSAGIRLAPQHLGLAASVGIDELPVYRRLKVALFCTGAELVDPGRPLHPGGIYNSNRYVLRALCEHCGCTVTDLGIVADSLDATRLVLRQAAADHDFILSSGGVSVGEEDHVKPAVEMEGELKLWKIAIKPGKPLAFGRVDEAAFIGLPGNPVAAFVTFLLLVRPFISAAQGMTDTAYATIAAEVAFDWPGGQRRREFLRVRRDAEGRLHLFSNQSSGVLSSVAWADGLVDVPAGARLQTGDSARFIPLSALMS
ncbi:MAG TPA: molybdopterin molybdotransferase MoeA, partial [Rhodocyclaceae bacterium]|nr:molybdopterin molybdotransferase MoeA [Rhodocyclaceae bacterium]